MARKKLDADDCDIYNTFYSEVQICLKILELTISLQRVRRSVFSWSIGQVQMVQVQSCCFADTFSFLLQFLIFYHFVVLGCVFNHKHVRKNLQPDVWSMLFVQNNLHGVKYFSVILSLKRYIEINVWSEWRKLITDTVIRLGSNSLNGSLNIWNYKSVKLFSSLVCTRSEE